MPAPYKKLLTYRYAYLIFQLNNQFILRYFRSIPPTLVGGEERKEGSKGGYSLGRYWGSKAPSSETQRYLGDYKDKRTKEQMEQAARSGKQNIAEGASQGTSLKGYIKLVGVARGSLEELLEDYKDFAIKNGISVLHPLYLLFPKIKN